MSSALVGALLALLLAGRAAAQTGDDPPSMAEVHGSLPPSDAPTSIRQLDLRPSTTVGYTPSPSDWRDAEVYLVMPDRFERGAGARPSGDPANGRTWHGGNIRGLIDRLPYIRPIANTLWVTPVLRNSRDTYHGYGAVNLLDVDPRFGTMADYRALVQTAHRLGMRVVMDFVFNHAGNVFSYRDGEQRFGPGEKEIAGISRELAPSELQSPEHFSRRGVASGQDWENPDAVLNADFGDPDNAFEPLRDLATGNRQTQNVLIRTAMYWMRETDIDGIRLDTVKHAAPSLWPRVSRTLTAYARALRSPAAPQGKRNFLLLGEVYSGNRGELARYVGTNGRGLPSVFDFASHFQNRAALQGKAPTSALEQSFHETKATFGERSSYLAQFHENHDVPRLLREGDAPEQMDVATAHTLFAAGMPQLFYGNEQAMPQMDDGNPNTGDPGNRPDMFAGRYKPLAIVGRSSFDSASRPYQRQRAMVAVRRTFEPLRRGEQWVRYSSPNGPGGYVFSRIHGRHEVVVAINTSDRPIDLRSLWVDRNLTAPGTQLVDALDDGYTTAAVEAEGGSQIELSVPARGVRVLVARPLYEERREDLTRAATGDGPTGVELDRPQALGLLSALERRPISTNPPAARTAAPPVRNASMARAARTGVTRSAARTAAPAVRNASTALRTRTGVAERIGYLRTGAGARAAPQRPGPQGNRPWRPSVRPPFSPRR